MRNKAMAKGILKTEVTKEYYLSSILLILLAMIS
jgi:hypothetical protein